MGTKQSSFDKFALARSRAAYQPYVMRSPYPLATGIAAAVALGTINVPQTLTLQPAATSGSYFTSGNQLFVPVVPVFTNSTTTDTFSFVIKGWDQFGDYYVERGNKVATQAESRFQLRAYSRIQEITVTPTSVPAGTIAVGYTYNSGTSQNLFALPYKPRRVSDWGLFVGIQSAGGGTYAGLTVGGFRLINAGAGNFLQPNGLVDANVLNCSVEKSLLSFSVGNQTVAATSPLEFLVNIDSSRINEFF